MTVEGQSPQAGGQEVVVTGEGAEGQGAAEAQAGGEPEKKPSELDFSKKFMELTDREKKLREREEKIKAIEEREAQIAERERLFKENPLKAVEEAGWQFKDLADQVLNDRELTTEQKLRKLEEQILADKKEREEREAQKERENKEAIERERQEKADKAIAKAKEDIKKLVDESDDYELIREREGYDLVFDVIQQVFDETNELITFKEAADKVEKSLEEEIERFFKVNKFAKKYKPISEESPEKINLGYNHYAERLLEEKYGRTLSNDMVADGSRAKAKEQKFLSDDESKEYLAKKLQQMLQSQA